MDRCLRLAIGSASYRQLADRQQRNQAQLAILTAILATLTAAGTILFAGGFFPPAILIVACISLVMFASVIPVYRFLFPRIPWMFGFANNLIPAALCLSCGFAAIYLGGSLTLSAIYGSAIPLLSVMICGRLGSYFWPLLTVCMLAIALLLNPSEEWEFPVWMNLVGGIFIIVPTLVSMLLHRHVWEQALRVEAESRRQLKKQHLEQRQLDKRLSDFERTQSLSLMAGRVAHDMNNLLTGILSSSELVLDALQSNTDEEIRDGLDLITRGATDAASLSSQLLDYAGKRAQTLIRFDLCHRVQKSMVLAQASLDKGIRIQTEFKTESWIHGDPVQIDQVLVNLVRNAAESYEETGPIQVFVDHSLLEEPLNCRARRTWLPPGEYARLGVRDHGRGIKASWLNRIFEPFFSQRQDGKGLGLASVAGIVESHGGAISVESRPNVGSLFSVFFPLAAPELEMESTRSDALPGIYRPRGATILVADDEPMVRKVVGQLLQKIGFEVAFAEDGQQACDVYHAHTFCALLLDISMPVMDGFEVMKQVRSLDPELPVILMSGYSRDCHRENGRQDRHSVFLAKPFSNSLLCQSLQELGVFEASGLPAPPDR